MINVAKIFVGVDVSKDHLDVYITHVDKSMRFKNSDTGYKKLIAELLQHDVQVVAFESTGGYEAKMARVLEKADFQIWLIDPSRIKAFIRSEGVKAKTDAIDAKMIALFASQKNRNYISKKFSDEHVDLRALAKRKEVLTTIIATEKKRFKQPIQTEYCKQMIQDHIEFMEQQKGKLEQKIKALISKNDDWKEKSSMIQSIPGVGEGTATILISHMPELGEIENKQIAALIGVAPYTQQSGSYSGAASIYGGRSMPRWYLYMATLTGVRYNPVLKEFYNKLRNAGKPAKVALVACMNKLIGIINTMLATNTYWKNA